MNSRLRVVVPVLLAALILFMSSPAGALEKATAGLADGFDGWRAGGTSASCLVDYYNICTGWVWTWAGWSPNDMVGVAFTSCCTGLGAEVDSSFVYFFTGAPSGYGYTGTIGIYDVDGDNCPTGMALASQSLLPTTGWNPVSFGAVNVSSNFAVAFQFGPGMGTPVVMVTDHPAQAPTGPVACGTCYPTSRENRTFYWGSASSPVCPGTPLNDGVCDAQFLWDASMHCVVSVESSSWGSIKGLYR